MKEYGIYSPNFDRKKRLINLIKTIVIHYTGMQSERESVKRLCNPLSKVSAHYLINQNGKILLFGNGGSASDSQHIAAELVGRYKANRKGLPAGNEGAARQHSNAAGRGGRERRSRPGGQRARQAAPGET